MPKVTLIAHDGATHSITAQSGQSLMQAATTNMVAGILAECGGNCSCATCHVYVEPEWTERTGAPAECERDLLQCVPEPRENSRLSCQITLTDEHDGLIVRLPKSQV